ncbi:MAG: TlpA family protein disulfide reductase [Hyphomicrobiales bacterium]
MKFRLIALLCMAFAMVGCNTQNPVKEKKKTIVKGVNNNRFEFKYEYSPLENGVASQYIYKEIETDTANNYALEFNISEPYILTLSRKYRGPVYVLVEPGKTYEVDIQPGDTINVRAESQELQDFYQTVESLQFASLCEKEYFPEGKVTDSIVNFLDNRMNNELAHLDSLYNKGLINKDAYELATLDRKVYNYYVLSSGMKLKYRVNFNDKDSIRINAEDLAYWETLYPKELIQNPIVSKSPHFPLYMDNYIYFERHKKHIMFTKEISKDYLKIPILMRQRATSKEVLSDTLRKRYLASYYGFHLKHFPYDSTCLQPFAELAKEFPNDHLTHYLQPKIDNIKKFYSASIPEGVEFLENYDQVNSMDELLAIMKGKRLYIDIYSTWCPPCLAQMKHEEYKTEALKKYDVTPVFLLCQDNCADDYWKKMIFHNDLKGIHLRVNQKFSQDLFDKFGWGQGIGMPRYMFINENGEIVNKEAYRPSSHKIEEQCEEAFKKS